MKNPTKKQRDIIERVASCGWDVVSGAEVTSATKSPYLHVEVDWEAGDPEHGDMCRVARLTDEGAAWYQQETGMSLVQDPDGSWVMGEKEMEVSPTQILINVLRDMGPPQGEASKEQCFGSLAKFYGDLTQLTAEEAREFPSAAPGWVLFRTPAGRIEAWRKGSALYETTPRHTIERTWEIFTRSTGISRETVAQLRAVVERT